MQRLCDLCDNPPNYKCGQCQSEMIEPPKALWWPDMMAGKRSIVTGSGSASLPPPDFLYV